MAAEPIDKKLYNTVKKMADEKFASKTGIYKSSWIVREYKRRGGKYKGRKPSSRSPGLSRWYKEEWVDLNRPIKDSRNKIIGYQKCGRNSIKKSLKKSLKKYPLCRPSKRITRSTPRTYKEIKKSSIQKAKREKEKVKGSKNISFGGTVSVSNGTGSSQKGTGPGSPQYYGKRSDVMIKVPKSVRDAAVYAFDVKKLGFKGGIETGWKRAKQLATKESIPIEDLKYMRNWFARHIYVSYPAYKSWIESNKPIGTDWFNKRGIIAWLIWGSTPAFKWVNSKKNVELLNKYYNKNYKVVTLPK